MDSAIIAQPVPSLSTMEREIQIVRRALARELRSLDSLLAYLAPPRSAAELDLLYGQIILSVGCPGEEGPNTLAHRCQLATALELLAAAILAHCAIAHATFAPASQLAGAAVLIGDFYFARAAQLVTQIGNPRLLDAFAHVLKIVSQEHLAHKSRGASTAYNAARELSFYGILCGAHLLPDGAVDTNAIAEAWQRLFNALTAAEDWQGPSDHLLRLVPEHQMPRWRTCAQIYAKWIAHASSGTNDPLI